MATKPQVIVAGAGPVGLLTALALAKQDVSVLVLEAEPDLTFDLRAREIGSESFFENEKHLRLPFYP